MHQSSTSTTERTTPISPPLPSSAPPQGVRRLYSLRIAADLSSPLRPSAVTKTLFQPARGDHARKENRREEYDQPVGAVPLEHGG
jgi:hypothetical protein